MGTEARLPYLLTAVAGGFAVTLARNETQRHSAALKSAGQSPIGLLPLCFLRTTRAHAMQVHFHVMRSRDFTCVFVGTHLVLTAFSHASSRY